MGSTKDDSPADGAETNSQALASDQGIFSEGEKVLAYHGPRIYEAKVQKVEFLKKERKYFVHYLGWNKNWDEWVSVDRLLKVTDENVRKQQTLAKNQGADKNSKSGRSTQIKPKSSNGGRGKKRKGDSGVEEKDTGSTEKLMKIQFPSTLKKQLVDDWEFVTQLGKLVKLPRNPNVDDILKKYLDYRSKKDGMIAESIGEILKGIRGYFDKALPAMLLYKKERQQYHEAVTDNISPSTVYGAEHLLRLFVKLPELLAYVNMEEEALTQLQQKLLDFLNVAGTCRKIRVHSSFLLTMGAKALKKLMRNKRINQALYDLLINPCITSSPSPYCGEIAENPVDLLHLLYVLHDTICYMSIHSDFLLKKEAFLFSFEPWKLQLIYQDWD
ncbi:protein MRG1 isoform X2 [Magnolia sinica]|uniref:protein MRG1 isoform X2 n=1 Tax=Magnolia sinica TaxID=86752 RepID=UPI00265A3E9D|nr:protein MRG1 isoform X2 [Magnolia sinica]